jgi:hypothetical protein
MKNDTISAGSKQGFIRTTAPQPSLVSADKKAALIRKGNEVFNQGDLKTAERIFLTVGYGDGLIRLGDRYYKSGQALEALRMYRLAHDSGRTGALYDRIVTIIRSWMVENHE